MYGSIKSNRIRCVYAHVKSNITILLNTSSVSIRLMEFRSKPHTYTHTNTHTHTTTSMLQ